MADGVSRSSGSVGVVNVVPGAGVTHCLSGIAEALLDGIPLVVIAAGIRRDTGRAYQLHDIDQAALLGPVTKAVLRPGCASDIYPMVRRAFDLAKTAFANARSEPHLCRDFPEFGGEGGIYPDNDVYALWRRSGAIAPKARRTCNGRWST